MSDYFTRIATAPKHVVQISTQGKTYLTIKQDGSVELGPDFSENEALRGFWDYAESLGPKKEIARLVAERDALRELLREALAHLKTGQWAVPTDITLMSRIDAALNKGGGDE